MQIVLWPFYFEFVYRPSTEKLLKTLLNVWLLKISLMHTDGRGGIKQDLTIIFFKKFANKNVEKPPSSNKPNSQYPRTIEPLPGFITFVYVLNQPKQTFFYSRSFRKTEASMIKMSIGGQDGNQISNYKITNFSFPK